MRRTLLLPLLLAAAAAACGGEPVASAGGPPLDGAWTGVAGATSPLPHTLVLEVEAVSGDVTGTAQLEAAGESVGLAVEGSYLYPELDLTLTAEGYVPLRLSGQYRRSVPEVGQAIRPDSITASLTGSGFNGTPIVLRRVEAAAAALFARR